MTIKDIAADIALGGVPLDTARNRISSYAQNGLLRPRREGPNTSPNLYSPRDSAVAVMLSALADCGVADLEMQRDVSFAAYLAIDHCLSSLARGEGWSLVVEVCRGAIGRVVSARLVQHDRPAASEIPVNMTPRGAIIVVLDEMLAPVVRRLYPPKGAN